MNCLAGKSNFTEKNNDKSLCCIEFSWCGRSLCTADTRYHSSMYIYIHANKKKNIYTRFHLLFHNFIWSYSMVVLCALKHFLLLLRACCFNQEFQCTGIFDQILHLACIIFLCWSFCGLKNEKPCLKMILFLFSVWQVCAVRLLFFFLCSITKWIISICFRWSLAIFFVHLLSSVELKSFIRPIFNAHTVQSAVKCTC